MSSRASRGRARRVAIVVHRYVGLVLAVFLLTAGVTGALLTFYVELDVAMNPELVGVTREPGAKRLDPFVLQARVQQQLPAGAEDRYVPFHIEPARAVSYWVETSPARYREYLVNPYTAAVQGSREWGNLGEGMRNLLPFVYRLHYSLALGEVGTLLFGLVALLWTVDCFVGAYLTFPAPQRPEQERKKSWLRRWLPAWGLKTSKLFSFVFSWHRASGLWIWAMLLVFAWSAVGLNLRAVYQPVMSALAGQEPDVHDSLPMLSKPYPKPRLSLAEAHARGQRLLAEQARLQGFRVERELWLSYHADHGVFDYSVASSLDVSTRRPRTSVYFDGQDGRFVAFEAARGRSAGNTITSWLYALHFAAVGGLWYRIFVAVMGLSVALLSVTGVWIWWRKRRSARRDAMSRPAVGAHADMAVPARILQ